jgi:hypothetical protein
LLFRIKREKFLAQLYRDFDNNKMQGLKSTLYKPYAINISGITSSPADIAASEKASNLYLKVSLGFRMKNEDKADKKKKKKKKKPKINFIKAHNFNARLF